MTSAPGHVALPSPCQRTKYIRNLVQSLLVNLASLRHLETDRAILAFDSLRDLIHILWLRHSFQVVFQNLGKVVCSNVRPFLFLQYLSP